MTPSKTFLRALMLGCALSLPVQADITAGLEAFERGELDAAISHYREDLTAPATMFEANWRTGQALVMSGKSKEALDFLEKAIELNDASADAHYWWGAANGEVAASASIFSALGYAKKCKAGFERAVELDPKHLDAMEGLISFHLEAPGMVGGDKDEALRLANRMVELDRARGLGQLASSYMALERTEDALTTFETAIADYPTSSSLYLQRGLILRELERYGEAAADFHTLAGFTEDPALTPDELAFMVALGRYFLGSVASLSGEHLTEGKSALEDFLEAGLYDEDWREGFALYYLASIHLHEGNKAEASALAERASKLKGPKDLRKRLKKLKKQIKKA